MTLTLTLKLKIAFSTLLPPGAYCSVSQSPPWFFIRPYSDGSCYGMVMSVRVSVHPTLRPSDSPSVRVSVCPFFALFSYMLWHIQLKFCTWLCFNVLRIKFECRHFASIFEGVMPLCELFIGNVKFSALFSYMLWDIELKFCINVLKIKFKCCLSVSSGSPSVQPFSALASYMHWQLSWKF